jgi:hypothetical protein
MQTDYLDGEPFLAKLEEAQAKGDRRTGAAGFGENRERRREFRGWLGVGSQTIRRGKRGPSG